MTSRSWSERPMNGTSCRLISVQYRRILTNYHWNCARPMSGMNYRWICARCQRNAKSFPRTGPPTSRGSTNPWIGLCPTCVSAYWHFARQKIRYDWSCGMARRASLSNWMWPEFVSWSSHSHASPQRIASCASWIGWKQRHATSCVCRLPMIASSCASYRMHCGKSDRPSGRRVLVLCPLPILWTSLPKQHDPTLLLYGFPGLRLACWTLEHRRRRSGHDHLAFPGSDW